MILMRTKVVFLAVFLLLSVIFSFHGVFAASAEQTINSVVEGFNDFTRFLLGDISGATSGEYFFVKLLVFILILSLVTIAVQSVPAFEDKRAISIIIALAVSLIAVRYITTAQLINFIWLPYGVLGIVFSSILPFILAFFFARRFNSPIITKVFWTAFGVIFLMLGILRLNDLSIGNEWYQNLAWVYVIIAILSGLLIFFDQSVRTRMFMSSLKGTRDRRARVEAAELSHRIDELKEQLAHATADAARDIRREIKDKERQISNLLRS